MSGGVGGLTGAIPLARPDQGSLYINNNLNNTLFTWVFVIALLGALISAWWRTAAILPSLFCKSEYQKPIHIPTATAAPIFRGEMLPTNDNAPRVHSATLVVLPNGELFAAWFGGSREGAADVAIYGAKRTAKGWNMSILANRTASEQELNRPIRKLGNPVLARTVDGRIWLFFVVTSLGGWSTSAIAYKISDDAGNHFGPAQLLVTSPVLNISTLVRARPLLYTDGSIALPAYHELLGKFGLMLRISPEARVISIAHIGGGRSVIQPSMIADSPTSVWAILRRTGNAPERVLIAHSDDAGVSWDWPQITELPNPDASIAVINSSHNTALIAYNPTTEGRHILRLARSRPHSRQYLQHWQYIRDLEYGQGDDEFSYPFLISNPQHGGEYHLMYTWQRYRIMHVWFNDAWLEQAP